jgi:hypothetical protein
MVVHICNPSTQAESGDCKFEANLGYIAGYMARPYFKKKKKIIKGWMPVAHTCNPSYLGRRDQEDCGGQIVHGTLKRAGEVIYYSTCLASNQALSSNPSSVKKNK